MHRLILALPLLLTACSHPNITLKEPPAAAIPVEQVTVVTDMPPQARVLAAVYAWSSVPVDHPVGYARAVADLRERAASIGAKMLWVPSYALVTSPAGSRWVEPDAGRDAEGDYVRPTELAGQAIAVE